MNVSRIQQVRDFENGESFIEVVFENQEVAKISKSGFDSEVVKVEFRQEVDFVNSEDIKSHFKFIFEEQVHQDCEHIQFSVNEFIIR